MAPVTKFGMGEVEAVEWITPERRQSKTLTACQPNISAGEIEEANLRLETQPFTGRITVMSENSEDDFPGAIGNHVGTTTDGHIR